MSLINFSRIFFGGVALFLWASSALAQGEGCSLSQIEAFLLKSTSNKTAEDAVDGTFMVKGEGRKFVLGYIPGDFPNWVRVVVKESPGKRATPDERRSLENFVKKNIKCVSTTMAVDESTGVINLLVARPKDDRGERGRPPMTEPKLLCKGNSFLPLSWGSCSSQPRNAAVLVAKQKVKYLSFAVGREDREGFRFVSLPEPRPSFSGSANRTNLR